MQRILPSHNKNVSHGRGDRREDDTEAGRRERTYSCCQRRKQLVEKCSVLEGNCRTAVSARDRPRFIEVNRLAYAPNKQEEPHILFKVFEERSFWKPICYAVLSIQGSIAWVLTFSPFIDGRSRDVLRGIPRGCCEQPRPMSYRPVLRAKGV